MTIMGRIFLILYRIISKLHGFQLTSHFVLSEDVCCRRVRLGSEKGLYDLVLSTRVLRPSLRTVRSVLPASSSSAKDLAARHGFHFRVTVVFSSVLRTPQKNYQLHCRNPACSVQQIPKYSVYSVYSVFVPGIC